MDRPSKCLFEIHRGNLPRDALPAIFDSPRGATRVFVDPILVTANEPPLHRRVADLLDLRRYAQPDRPRLRRSVPARLPPRARSVAGPGADPGRLLGRVRPLSGAHGL